MDLLKEDDGAPQFVDQTEYFKKVYNQYLQHYNTSGISAINDFDTLKDKGEASYDKNLRQVDDRIRLFKEHIDFYISGDNSLKNDLMDLIENEALSLSENQNKTEFLDTYEDILLLINKIDDTLDSPSPKFKFDAWQLLDIAYEDFTQLRRTRLRLMAMEAVSEAAIRKDFPKDLPAMNKKFEQNPLTKLIDDFLMNELNPDPKYIEFYKAYFLKYEEYKDRRDFTKKSKQEIKKQHPKLSIPADGTISNAVTKWKARTAN